MPPSRLAHSILPTDLEEVEVDCELHEDERVDENEDEGDGEDSDSDGSCYSCSSPVGFEYDFGHPLERMASRPQSPTPDDANCTTTPDHTSAELRPSRGGGRQGAGGFYLLASAASSSSSSGAGAGVHLVDFEKIVDEYMARYGGADPRELIIVEPAAASSGPSASLTLMLKRTPFPSSELALLSALDTPVLARDPWNPAPRVLYAARRGGKDLEASSASRDGDEDLDEDGDCYSDEEEDEEEEMVLCFERLWADNGEDDLPPMCTVANVIDYVRQALEGLSFLHEHSIGHGSYNDPRGVMLALGARTATGFDRATQPVRYYRVDFSRAEHLPLDPDDCDPLCGIRAGVAGKPARTTDAGKLATDAAKKGTDAESRRTLDARRADAFAGDVRACADLLAPLIFAAPPIAGKLRALGTALMGGEYGAEDARKLWEALCRGVGPETYAAALEWPPPQSRIVVGRGGGVAI